MKTVADGSAVGKKGAFWPFTRVFDKTVDVCAVLAMVLLCVAVIITTAEVTMRFFFNKPLMWSIEVTEYSLIWITFLGTAWVLRKEGHVIVDVIVMRIPAASRHILDAVLSFIGILMCFLLVWYGVKVTLDFIHLNRQMSTILMPPASVLYLVVPLGSLLLTIQFIRRTIINLNKWKAVRRKKAESTV